MLLAAHTVTVTRALMASPAGPGRRPQAPPPPPPLSRSAAPPHGRTSRGRRRPEVGGRGGRARGAGRGATAPRPSRQRLTGSLAAALRCRGGHRRSSKCTPCARASLSESGVPTSDSALRLAASVRLRSATAAVALTSHRRSRIPGVRLRRFGNGGGPIRPGPGVTVTGGRAYPESDCARFGNGGGGPTRPGPGVRVTVWPATVAVTVPADGDRDEPITSHVT